MLPISQVIFTQMKNDSTWILYDVYKVAPHFPLEISVFGYILPRENALEFDIGCAAQQKYHSRVQVVDKFQSKSTRNDLKGLKLMCGLVIAYPEQYTYLEDVKVENVDIFTKSSATVAANMRESLNLR